MVVTNFISYEKSICEILDMLKISSVLKKQKNILIKPNIVNRDSFPITTPPKICENIVLYIKKHSNAQIIIGDGCGSPEYSTIEAFKHLGYDEISNKYNIDLVDLNTVPLKKYKDSSCLVHKEMHLPELIKTHYIISVPVLKAHSLTQITGSMKNMMGLLPPKYYMGKHGVWNKAVFHNRVHESIIDLNKYVSPSLTILDATVGMAEFHLGGAKCDPPVNKLVAGFDAKEVDRKAAELLGFNWNEIDHLK
ncbi:DUF362 domain-containing protein [Herbivorax sp. ANBcel31]|uniref:DUF362 domain-containing protein n=1 Tax=Herbivorax sp. ANBcel31 TaxID=3069754 RepID=UPI0027B47412|nr:DUF362 domain-containing protein [Herbivorax sp. ANBcel31]MDQ2087868.1 DUF362 domain-containing protein [Herbivorax sp. ANBcel31]